MVAEFKQSHETETYEQQSQYEKHINQVTRPYMIPGLPCSVYNQYRYKHNYNHLPDEHKATCYRWMMGLAKVQEIDDTAKLDITSQSSWLAKFKTGLALWTRRNVLNASQNVNLIN